MLKSFDVTDNGFHLSKAWGMLHGSWDANLDFWVGASFFNGLWLSIIGKPSLLWARFGWLIVVSLIVLFSYKIIKLYFKGLKPLLFTFILSFLFVNYNYYLTINYDNLPLLITLIASYLLLLNSKNNKISYLIISGFLFGLTFFIKFNYILIFGLPVVYFLFKYEFFQISKRFYLKKALYLYMGYAFALLFFFLFLFFTNSIEPYKKYMSENFIHRNSKKDDNYKKTYNKILNFNKEIQLDTLEVAQKDTLFSFLTDSLKKDSIRTLPLYVDENAIGDSHTLKNLFNNYFVHFWQVLNKGFIFAIIFLIFIYILSLLKNRILQYSILLFFSFMFFYYVKIYLQGRPSVTLSEIILPGYLFAILFKRDKKYSPLVLLILLMVLFSFPGSDLTFNVVYRSGAGLLLFLFPILYLWDLKQHFQTVDLKFSYYSKFILIFAILSTVFSWDYVNVHRDFEKRSLLITQFKAKQLFGIQTTPQRVEVVNELMSFFNKEEYERNNTPAIFVGWIPMFYYLTETNSIFSDPWKAGMPLWFFQEKLTSQKIKPKYITISNKFTRNPNWPLLDKEYKKKDQLWIKGLRLIDYSRYYAEKNNYTKIFENKMFEVWKLE